MRKTLLDILFGDVEPHLQSVLIRLCRTKKYEPSHEELPATKVLQQLGYVRSVGKGYAFTSKGKDIREYMEAHYVLCEVKFLNDKEFKKILRDLAPSLR